MYGLIIAYYVLFFKRWSLRWSDTAAQQSGLAQNINGIYFAACVSLAHLTADKRRRADKFVQHFLCGYFFLSATIALKC